MPSLATHLKHAMLAAPPQGWRPVGTEHPLLPPHVSTRLGYTPKADLVVESIDTGRRLWIELEISRADPVANHAKFAALSQLHPIEGTFVSMMSPDIKSGKRVVGAHAINMMRQLNLDAFQTSLLPQLTGPQIKALNSVPLEEVQRRCPPIGDEWKRLIAVVKPLHQTATHRILFVGNLDEVGWNAHRWNKAVATPQGRRLWGGKRGRRTVQHFVHAPFDDLFAPSKFAAFVPSGGHGGMSMDLYADLDESETRFDGHIAWQHLERLGYTQTRDPVILAKFWDWQQRHQAVLTVLRKSPIIWKPPPWL